MATPSLRLSSSLTPITAAFPPFSAGHHHRRRRPEQLLCSARAESLKSFRIPATPISWISLSGGFSCHHYVLNKASRYRNDVMVRSQAIEASSSGSSDGVNQLPDFAAGVSLATKLRGLCFYALTSVLALFLIVAMFAAHPFVLLFDRYKRKFHHYVAKIWASLTVKPFFSIEIEGLENLPPSETPAVYVSNHQSFLDTYTLLTLGRSFKLISKTSIFLIPVIGWAMFMMGTIPLRRMDTLSHVECLKRCLDLLKNGGSVFFFPEGTRRGGGMGSFKKGAFSLAAKVGVPVVPIALVGTGQLMPAGKEGILNKGSVRVIIHKPLEGRDAELLRSESEKLISQSLSFSGEAGLISNTLGSGYQAF